MKVFFIRHGESEANVKKILSSRPEEPYDLTTKGVSQVIEATRYLSRHKFTAIYSSPLLRTMHSATIIKKGCSIKAEPIIDFRLAEVNYGKYSGKPNNQELDDVRLKQVNGDYEVRFGIYGENRRQVLMRICDFLLDVIERYRKNDKIIVVCHGTVITIAENFINNTRKATAKHIHTENAATKCFSLTADDVPIFKTLRRDLLKMKDREIRKRLDLIENKFRYFDDIEPKVQLSYKKRIMEIARSGVDNPELNNEVLDMFTTGFYLSKLETLRRQISREKLSDGDVILICAFKNAKKLLGLFMSHYIAIGIKNFVLIDNDSDDGSLSCIESIIEPVNIDIFVTKDKFDSFKSCGWRQRMIAYYGANRWYLDLDVDELMVFPGVEEGGIGKIIAYAESHKLQAIGSFMLDIYPNRPILKIDKDNNDLRSDYKYIDVDTYNLVSNPNYNYRIFGGPRYRMLKVRPSLQKFPLIFVNGQTININPHFWYPFKLNFNSSLVSALLHYKFLPGDLEQYKVYAKTGVHWDNSSEYKVYVKALRANPKLNFFDAGHSVEYEDSGTLSELKRSDGQPLLSDINN